MATPHVSLTTSLTVFPKTLNPSKLLELSNLDRQCPLHMYLIFFYNPSSIYTNSSLDSVFTKLKIGLEETLSVWSPAAGRLEPNPADGKLNLRCDNRGAILARAVTDVKISELGDLSNYNEFFEELVHKPVLDGDFCEFPLVVAQVRGCLNFLLLNFTLKTWFLLVRFYCMGQRDKETTFGLHNEHIPQSVKANYF